MKCPVCPGCGVWGLSKDQTLLSRPPWYCPDCISLTGQIVGDTCWNLPRSQTTPGTTRRFNYSGKTGKRMHNSIRHILQFFGYQHLPVNLQEISKPFSELAEQLAHQSPQNPELTVALRKLLESKDAAVRAHLSE